MPKAEATIEVETNGDRNEVFEGVRKIVLAGIGGVALAQDEIAKFLNKMVERGEIAEKDARKLLDEARKKQKETSKKSQEQVENRFEDVLARMNVPSKSDIDALSEKITRLTEKVDQLQKDGN